MTGTFVGELNIQRLFETLARLNLGCEAGEIVVTVRKKEEREEEKK